MLRRRGLESFTTPPGARMYEVEERLEIDYEWRLSHLEEQRVRASCGRTGWKDGWTDRTSWTLGTTETDEGNMEPDGSIEE